MPPVHGPKYLPRRPALQPGRAEVGVRLCERGDPRRRARKHSTDGKGGGDGRRRPRREARRIRGGAFNQPALMRIPK